MEQLEFIVSSFPTIGVVNARNLLRKFNSIKSLVNAGKQELTEVEGIGEKTAEKLIKLFYRITCFYNMVYQGIGIPHFIVIPAHNFD